MGTVDYTLPDLGTGSRHPPAGRESVTVSAESPVTEGSVRSAFAHLLLLYLDTDDFVFLQDTRPFRATSGSVTPVQNTDQPVSSQAVFYWNSQPSPSHTSSLVLTAQPSSITLSYSTQTIASASANILLQQILHKATSDQPLPSHLLSVYEPPYDESHATLALEWLAENARERPDSVAHEIYTTNGLDEPPELLTYQQLDEQSNAFARSRDALFYVAHAGIWKAGGCYVAIDTDLPDERKRFIATNSEALLVLTTEDYAHVFDKSVIHPDLPSDTSSISHAELDKLAYLLYTSGTTGVPKGCLLNHRGLFYAIDAMTRYPRSITVKGKDKRLALASIAFDVHISEITQVWKLGITLVSGQRYELLADMRAMIERVGITHLGMVPSMIEATLSPEGEGLKYLVSGGEKMSDNLLKNWASHPRVMLANFYGPTEATVGCTSRIVGPTDRKENIGKPFDSCHAYVLAPGTLDPVPRGTPGELVVTGPLVGVGYLGLPEVTKKVFITFRRKRAYRTGDSVRMMPDGSLEIMGRIDTQIKLRGVRIEAEGVSSVLREAVEEQVEVETIISKEMLVSFVAYKSDATFKTRRTVVPKVLKAPQMVKKMKERADKELAVYMRPTYILPIEWMPLSLNGKTDGKVLKQMFEEVDLTSLREEKEETGQDEAPTEEEEKVIAIIRDVLVAPTLAMTPRTNLFQLGFDSMRFARLANQLGLAVAKVMSLEDVRGLASALSSSGSSAKADVEVDLATKEMVAIAQSVFAPDEIEDVLPLFPVQEGVLFHTQTRGEEGGYVQHFMYQMDTEAGYGVEEVRNAWKGVVKRQQILRTVFVSDDEGTIVQVVLKDGVSELPFDVCESNPSSTPFTDWFLDAQASDVAKRVNADLTSPLWRVSVYGVCMVFSINHALYDGNAMPLLINDFRAVALSSPISSEPVKLAEVIRAMPPQDDPEMKKFYVDTFNGVSIPPLPPTTGTDARYVTYPLDTISFADVKEKCGNEFFVTLQTFWSIGFALAFDWKGGEPVFGVVRSGRAGVQLRRIEEAVCPLVSVVPTRIEIDSDVEQLLRKAQGWVSESLKYELVKLGDVRRWVGEKDLVGVLFSCRVEEEGKRPTRVVRHVGSSKGKPEFYFNVEVVMNPVEDSVEARVAWVEPGITREEVDVFLKKFEGVLEDVLGGHYVLPASASSSTKGPSSSTVAPSPSLQVQDPQLTNLITTTIASFLRIPSSSIHTNSSLTALGLSSIRAVALSRVLKEQGVRVSAVDVVQGDLVREVVKRATLVRDTGGEEKKNVSKEENDKLTSLKTQLQLPANVQLSRCTALQTGMLSQTISSNGELYVHAFVWLLKPSTNPRKVKEAWENVARDPAMDVLRTGFLFTNGEWVQVIRSPEAASLKWSEWDSREGDDIHGVAREFIQELKLGEEARLAEPLVYFLQVRSGEKTYVVVVLHHALYDGIAIPKLFRRVKEVYLRLSSPSSEHPSLEAVASFQSIVPEILKQQGEEGTAFWSRRLEGLRPSSIPRLPSSSSISAWRSSIKLSVPAPDVRRFCRRYHVHPQCIGQAAWGKVLARTIGEAPPDVVFGQVVSGRTVGDAPDRVIGPVFNTIPCRITLKPGETNRQLIKSIHEWNTSALVWQHASLRAIQRKLGVKALFDTLFLYQPKVEAQTEREAEGEDPWTTVGKGNMQEGKTQYGINVELHEGSETFSVFASCASDVASYEGLVDLLKALDEAFVDLIRSPNSLVLPHDDPLFTTPSPPTATTPTATTPADTQNTIHSWTTEQERLFHIILDFVQVPRESVSPSTSLISIGVDSISSIQVASLSRKAGIRLSATEVAKAATVGDVVGLLEHRSASTPTLHSPPTTGLPEEVIARVRKSLSSLGVAVEKVLPAPAGMVYYQATEDDLNVFTYEVERSSEDAGMISRKVREAWRDMAAKHDVLRSFLYDGDEGGEKVLCVMRKHTYEFEWAEWRIQGQDELEEVRKLGRIVKGGMQLQDRPPVKLALLHGVRKSYMIISLHHSVYDGWSLPLLMKDFESIYAGKQTTEINGDIEPFVVAASCSSENLSEQEKYWRSLFPVNFQADLFPRLNSGTPRNVSSLFTSFFLPNRETTTSANTFVNMAGLIKQLDVLQSRARALNLTVQSVLLACWSLAQVGRSLKTKDSVTFLLSQAARSDFELVAAPTVNYVPTHVKLGGRVDVAEIAKRIQAELSARSFVVEQSHLMNVTRWIGNGGPIANVAVNVLRLPGSEQKDVRHLERIFKPVKFQYTPKTSTSSTTKFPGIQHDCQVEMHFHPSTDSIGISIECKPDLMSERQAVDICQEWALLVNEFRS